MRDERRVEINMSGIPVAGIGGLGLVAMAVVVSIYLPAASWTMSAGLSGGVVLAVALVAFRRVRWGRGPSGDDPKILFRVPESEPETRPAARTSRLDPRYSTL
jgi:hypothetical protein